MNSQKTSSTELNQLLRINDLTALTTLSKSCIKLWVAQGKFPPPLSRSPTPLRFGRPATFPNG